ncbi:MAG: EAL domain-containing protein [Deltaproteobacteria bacterium]|nr:EAL domain-containing protein [Deltaproteobacteria bacterium]
MAAEYSKEVSSVMGLHVEGSSTKSARPILILLIEDRLPDAKLFQKILSQAGDADRYWLIHVKRLSVALRMLERERVDVVMLDLTLPDSHGLGAIESIRSVTPGLPIVVLTGLEDDSVGVDALKKGAQDYLLKDSITAESLSASIKHAIERQKLWSNLEDELQKERYVSDFDELTKLASRQLYETRLEYALEQAHRESKVVGIFFMDVNGFRKVNEDFGSQAGDYVLKTVSDRLSKLVRKNDTVSRYGDDKFALTLYDIRDADSAAKVAKKILQLFSEPVLWQDQIISLTASLGISVYPADDLRMNRLLGAAEASLYQAKAQGKNTYAFFSRLLNLKINESNLLEIKLKEAIETKNLKVSYSPLFNLSSRTVRGFAAKIEFLDLELENASKSQLISLADQAALIPEMNRWLLRSVCGQIVELYKSGFPKTMMSLRLYPEQLHHPDFIESVRSALAEFSLEPSLLHFDFSESVIPERGSERAPERMDEILERLSEIGVRLNLCDYGVGHSSLTYLTHLRKFALDAIKIPPTLIHKLNRSKEARDLVESAIAIAHQMRLKVMAEGVDQQDLLRKLEELGCDEAHGSELGENLHSESIPEFLQREIAKLSDQIPEKYTHPGLST